MKRQRHGPRNKVFLDACSDDKTVIEQLEVSYDVYYEGSTEMIDSSEYRKKRGIRRIIGVIYNASGQVQQSFENHYDTQGIYVHGRAVHQDGTVIER